MVTNAEHHPIERERDSAGDADVCDCGLTRMQELSLADCQIPADVIWRLVLVVAAHAEMTKLDLSGHPLSGPMIGRLRERTRTKRINLVMGPHDRVYGEAMF